MPPQLRQFIGCPFQDRARGETIDPITRRPFFDCCGLMLAIFREFGIDNVPDYGKDISCFASDQIFEQFKRSIGEWEPLQEPEAPCLVTMSLDRNHPEFINHFGIYIGDRAFIHTRANTHSIKSNIDDPIYRRIIKGYYRWIKRSS